MEATDTDRVHEAGDMTSASSQAGNTRSWPGLLGRPGGQQSPRGNDRLPGSLSLWCLRTVSTSPTHSWVFPGGGGARFAHWSYIRAAGRFGWLAGKGVGRAGFGWLEEETGDRVETVLQAAEVGGSADVHAVGEDLMACSPLQVVGFQEVAGLGMERFSGSGQGVDGFGQSLPQVVNGGDRRQGE